MRGVLQESSFSVSLPSPLNGAGTRADFLPRKVRFFCSPSSEATSIQDTTKRVRVNRMIRISPVRVIGADGSQLGILEVDQALRMAEEAG